MRTVEPTPQADQVRHLSENLMTQLAKGKEWATPGVEAALQRAVAGLDTGIESASPRIQAALRRIADELAGGVETLTPRVHEGLKRVVPKGAPVVADSGPAEAPWPASRKTWFIVGMLAVAVSAVVAWRSFRTAAVEPASSSTVQSPNSGTPEADPATADPGLAI
jgi:hypothetical protein